MTSPYVTPEILTQSALGIAWNTIPSIKSNPSQQLAEQTNMCWRGTERVDNHLSQTMRASLINPETVYGPGAYVRVLPDGSIRAMTRQFPVVKVVSVSYARPGGPPYSWQTIPTANAEPEVPPFGLIGSSGASSATGGMNAIRIGAWTIPMPRFTQRETIPLQLVYTAGWPHSGITPSATPTGTWATATTAVTTLSSDIGLVDGAPITGPGIAPGTTIAAFTATTITLSQDTTAAGTGDMLTVGWAPGTTVMGIDDVTTWTGVQGTIYDGVSTETVEGLSVTPNVPGIEPTGPGTITLVSPLVYGHLPAVLCSALPPSAQEATMYAVAAQALIRGANSVTVPSAGGTANKVVSGSSGVEYLLDQMAELLGPYRRVI